MQLFNFFKKKPLTSNPSSPSSPSSPPQTKQQPLKQQPLKELFKDIEFLTESHIKQLVKGELKVAPDKITLASISDSPTLTLSELLVKTEGEVASILREGEYIHVLRILADILENSSFISKGKKGTLTTLPEALEKLTEAEKFFLNESADYQIIKANCTQGEKRGNVGIVCSEIQVRFSNFLRNTEAKENDTLKRLLTDQLNILEDKIKVPQWTSLEELQEAIKQQVALLENLPKEKEKIYQTLKEKNIGESDLLLTDSYLSFFGALYGLMNMIEHTDEKLIIPQEKLTKGINSGTNSPQTSSKNLQKMESFFGELAEKLDYSEDHLPYVFTFSNGVSTLMGSIDNLLEKTTEEKKINTFLIALASFLDVINSKRPKLDQKDVRKSRKSHKDLKQIQLQQEIIKFDMEAQRLKK